MMVRAGYNTVFKEIASLPAFANPLRRGKSLAMTFEFLVFINLGSRVRPTDV
jgi:hypothetical protein